MQNALEMLIHLNKNFIMNSKFQNVVYEGQKLYKYLGEKKKTRKEGETFNSLIFHLIDKLPIISYENAIKYHEIYERYPHLYLCFVGQHNYLIQVSAFLQHIEKYKNENEIPVSFYLPSFFSRSYKIVFLNKTTKAKRIQEYPTNNKGKPNQKAYNLFLNLVYLDKSYEEILKNIVWGEYEALINDLNNFKSIFSPRS